MDVRVFRDPNGCFEAGGNNLSLTSCSDKAGRTGRKAQQFPAALEDSAADSHLWEYRAKISEERTNDAIVWSVLWDAFTASSWFSRERKELERKKSEGKTLSREEAVPVSQGKWHPAEQGCGAREPL